MEPGNECELESGEIGFLDCELCCWDLLLLSWLGDNYCDQFVNIYDIIILIQCLLENDFLYCSNDCTDVNEDGNINILDVIGIVNIILN
jgi:hypothetical protein